MQTRLFTLAFLTLTLSVAAQAEPIYKSPTPANYRAPAADLEKWANRIQKLCPEKGWTVSVDGNDVLIVRDKLVGFKNQQFNLRVLQRGETRTEAPAFEKTYRLRLRFSPLMSQDKYEQLVAENAVINKQDAVLLDKYRLYYRFEQLRPREDFNTFEQRQSDYLKQSKLLVLHRLPQFYTPDYSMTLYHSWEWFQYVTEDNPETKRECDEVQEKIVGYFGNYVPVKPSLTGWFGTDESRME